MWGHYMPPSRRCDSPVLTVRTKGILAPAKMRTSFICRLVLLYICWTVFSVLMDMQFAS